MGFRSFGPETKKKNKQIWLFVYIKASFLDFVFRFEPRRPKYYHSGGFQGILIGDCLRFLDAI